MGFSDKQTRALGRKVPTRNIRSRISAGRELAYIEGWYALAQANHIFGFDGWDRETVETKCLFSRETRGNYTAVYSARVRISVRANDAMVVRDGHGTGEAHGASAGEVHDLALKAAETDATKRALATFGKAFGLALYAGAGRSARSDAKKTNAPIPADMRSPLARATGSEETASPPSRQPAMERSSGASAKAANAAFITRPDERLQGGTKDAVARTNDVDHSGPVPSPDAAELGSQTETNGSAASVVDSTGDSRTDQTHAPARIDKSVLSLAEPHRVRDKEHLRFVAAQPCLLCSASPCDAHHLRFAQPRALSRKVGDDYTVPICRKHHRELHLSGNEAAFWHDMGIDALEVARQFWEETGERRKGRIAGRPSH